jgi:hypothetical protein
MSDTVCPLSAINFQQLKRGITIEKASPAGRLITFIGKNFNQKKIKDAQRKGWDTAIVNLDAEQIGLLEDTDLVISFHYTKGVVAVMSMKTCNEIYGEKTVEESKKASLKKMHLIEELPINKKPMEVQNEK